MAEGSNQKKGFNPITLVLIVIIIALLGGGVYLFTQLNSVETGMKSEPNVFLDDESADAYLEDKVTSISVNMSQKIYCEKDEQGKLVGEINAVNDNDFQYMIQFIMADTGETLYETGLIQAGNQLKSIPINMEFEPGRYPVNVIFNAISSEDNQTNLGSVGINVEMVVRD